LLVLEKKAGKKKKRFELQSQWLIFAPINLHLVFFYPPCCKQGFFFAPTFRGNAAKLKQNVYYPK